jgi:heme/copper-type cytochrome/quinol oxidase subunit 3
VAAAELIASIGLAVSTLVAATVVSIGIARADVASNVIDNESGVFAIALLLGLLFIGMGGLTFLSLPHHRHKKTHG